MDPRQRAVLRMRKWASERKRNMYACFKQEQRKGPQWAIEKNYRTEASPGRFRTKIRPLKGTQLVFDRFKDDDALKAGFTAETVDESTAQAANNGRVIDIDVADTTSHSFSFTGLNHIAFCVENLDRSLQFYHGVLGMKSEVHPCDFPVRRACLLIGEQRIHLMQNAFSNRDPVKKCLYAHVEFGRRACIDCTNVEGVRLALQRAGFPYKPSMAQMPSIFTRDPDGNGLEFREVDDNFFLRPNIMSDEEPAVEDKHEITVIKARSFDSREANCNTNATLEFDTMEMDDSNGVDTFTDLQTMVDAEPSRCRARIGTS
ncbi:unnamed protein product [Calypogeia fissa]